MTMKRPRNGKWSGLEALVVVAGLEEVNPLVTNEVHDPVLLRDAAGPGAWRQVLERFGLSNSREGIAEDRLNKAYHAEGRLSIGSNPIL